MRIFEGEDPIDEAHGIELLQKNDHEIICHVRAGSYRFKIQNKQL